MKSSSVVAAQPSALLQVIQKNQRDWDNFFALCTRTASIRTMTVYVAGRNGVTHPLPIRSPSDFLDVALHLSRLEAIKSVVVGTRDWGDMPHTFDFH
ncbi:MAG: hypothetical protein ACHQU0_02165 [Candidatus Paceibacteria bacterium]